jgi:lipoprotein NlpD
MTEIIDPQPAKSYQADGLPMAVTSPLNGEGAPPQLNANNTSMIGALNWAWPTDLPIAQPFSESRKGVDFSGVAGQPVKAVANGIANYIGNSLRGYGQMVVIKHDQGFISVYANNSKILVKEGQKIEKGQKIAETGHADGSDLALHFELRQQGKPLDPSSLFPVR